MIRKEKTIFFQMMKLERWKSNKEYFYKKRMK